MVFQSLQQLAAVRDRPAVREFGLLFLLLLASKVLQLLVPLAIEAVSDLMLEVFDPQLVGSAVYAMLGVTTLAAIYAVTRHLRTTQSGLKQHERLNLGGVTGILLLVCAYWLHGAADLPVFPGDVVTSLLTSAVAMGLPALIYARVREIDMRIEVPDRNAVSLVGGAAVMAALAGVGGMVAFTATVDTRIIMPIRGLGDPQLSASMLLLDVVLPGVFVGIGLGILYTGALQERLREYVSPAGAVAAVTALIGISSLEFRIGQPTTAVATAATVPAVVFLSLLAAFLVVWGTQSFSQSLDSELTPSVAASVSGLVVVLSLLGMSAVGLLTATFVLYAISFTVLAAIATVGYERSRSVWVPALAFASYQIVVDTDLALYLVRVLR